VKRSLGLTVGLLLALFAGATIVRFFQADEEEAGIDAAKAERLRRFWTAYHQGAEARTEGDYDSASEFFREALAIDPEHEDSLFYLAISLEETGRYDEAAGVLRRLTAVNPETSRGWSQLGALLARRAPGNVRDADAARAAFLRVEEINQEHSGPFLSYGNLALDGGDLAEARRLFRIASDMSSPEGAFLAGLVAFLERKDDEATRSFVRVLEASAREKAITGRGVTSEGDVAIGAKLTPLESAHIRALVFLHWSAHRQGGYPEDVPEAFRVEIPRRAAMGRAVKSAPVPRTPDCDPKALGLRFEGTLVDAACSGGDVFLLLWKRPARLFRNGAAGYAEVTDEAGLKGVGGNGLSALFFDFDRDGDSDLLVTAHAPLALSLRRLLHPEGRASTGTPRLFENQAGRFVDVTARVGLDRPFGVVEAEAFDVDSDGWEDLVFAMGGFEANHLEPSVVLRNREGKALIEWAHIPSSEEPHNALGVDVTKRNGAVEILLVTSGGAS
jgi:Flp pilus assembly protein TadD